MNPIVVTVIVSAATLIVSLFAANYLNQRFSERILDQQTKTFDAKLEIIGAKLDAFRSEMRVELNALRAEVANLAQRVGRIERQLDKIFKPVLPSS